jgi:uncharacterized protein (DUF1800 family)
VADTADITHLLRRTEFVARPARVAELSALSLAQAVDNILDITPNANPQVPAGLTVYDQAHGWQQYSDACFWWLGNMVNLPRPIQEKMTLFWHGHFTSAWFDGIGRADHMMHQNQLYRVRGMGDLLTLTQMMAVEPAMLVYLSNNVNRKGSPNQNFARELMELFTLGVGNYSEDDVVAAARAWTGHNADWPAYAYQFVSSRHDYGNKTFFGTTKNWDGPDIINEILRDNAGKRQIAARYITKKLWNFFAYPNGPAAVIDELTAVFVANNLGITPLLRAMFNHPEFYSAAAKQGLVRSPVEFVVAIGVHTGIPMTESGFSWLGERMGQSLFNPPNVAGWKANSYWLTTSAISGRAQVARGATWKLRADGGFDNLNSMSVGAALDTVANYFGVTSLSASSRAALTAAQQTERSAQKWKSWWAPTNLLTMMMLTPEFNMA